MSSSLTLNETIQRKPVTGKTSKGPVLSHLRLIWRYRFPRRRRLPGGVKLKSRIIAASSFLHAIPESRME
ncbi:MAG TPA: hypothetical protein VNZ68_00105, partial [Rhodocyclaceae bacterium]|nr:hypothetical protein [Rhodocyclaceae bacterium]